MQISLSQIEPEIEIKSWDDIVGQGGGWERERWVGEEGKGGGVWWGIGGEMGK